MLSTHPAATRPESTHRETPPATSHQPTRIAAAATGITAAAVALAAGELTSAAVDAEQSLVTAIGNEFIDRFAARLKELAVELFGTNDKIALVTGIVVVSLVLGAGLGMATRRTRWAAPLGFAAFGALGGWAMATDPLGSKPDAVVSSLVAVVCGLAAFAGLWRLASQPSSAAPLAPPVRPTMAGVTIEVSDGEHRRTTFDRRGFVTARAAALVVAGSASVFARRVRSGRTIDAVRRSTVLPRPARAATLPEPASFAAVEGLTPYVTPTGDFYRIDTALSVPQVDSSTWRLEIDGLADAPFSIGYDELLAMDSVEEIVTLQCVSNEVGGSLVGNAVWQGVPLSALLERAGARADATQIVGHSVDGFTAGFPASALEGRTALVAYAMNGEPLPAKHGYPARLVVAGLYGYVSATKWLNRIELTTWDDFDGYWISRGWSKEGPIKTASRIDVPRSNADLTRGRQPIAGVAWAPERGISRVEVQVDDGDWMAAELGRVASDDTWVQWYVEWEATPGEHRIRARATDADGVTQTADVAPPAPNGATGYPERRVDVA